MTKRIDATRTKFNPVLVEKMTANQFKKWYEKSYEGKPWDEVYTELGGKIKTRKAEDDQAEGSGQ